MMVLTNEELNQAEDAILSIVDAAAEPVPPEDVIGTLRSKGFSEFPLRAALWILLDRRKIEFTRQRLVRIPREVTSPSGRQTLNGR
jgi:hypothetical protein